MMSILTAFYTNNEESNDGEYIVNDVEGWWQQRFSTKFVDN